ncbi:hypothetical protein [Paenibacillus sp. NPDC057934]|uniref:hypothetical protein n=1 Tax=Paenibacillus sp. NPDC057934 TaxID=3346282 RepID=UPI0036DD13DE
MKKYAGMTVTAVLTIILAGCSVVNHTGNTQSGGNAAQQASSSPAGPAAVETASPEPVAEASPTAENAEAAEVLDTGKLSENFGFADAEGKQILVTAQEEGQDKALSLLDRAIGNNGQVLTVNFVKWQPGSEDGTGREMAHNFAHLPGYLFTVEEESAFPDATYYLTTEADFNAKSLLDVKPANEDLAHPPVVGEDVQKAIAAVRKREIQSIGKIADLSPDRELYVVQFVRQDKDMLFSLVLKEGESLAFMDYPAVAQDDDYSVWRVDDGGEVTPEMFSVLFAAQKADGVLLGINWWGAEGVNTFFLDQHAATFKELDIQYGRYTSPL